MNTQLTSTNPAHAPVRPREPRPFADAPGLFDEGWLPADLWPDLDELRAEHLRLLEQQREVGHERVDLADGFEEEDTELHEERTAAFREGREPGPDGRTPPAEREAALNAAAERSRAATAALDQFLVEAVARVEELAPGWLADIAESIAAAGAKRAEAARLLAEADAEESRFKRAEHWVERNGGLSERRSHRDIPSVRFVAWQHLVETYSPPDLKGDEDGEWLPVAVDPPSIPMWDAEQRAAQQRVHDQAYPLPKPTPDPADEPDEPGTDYAALAGEKG